MTLLIYDGSLEGFLTAVFHVFERKIEPCMIYADEESRELLFTEVCEKIPTDPEKFQRVFKGIQKRISSLALRNLIYCFYSRNQEIEGLLLDYLKKGFSIGAAVDHDLNFSAGVKLNRIARQVRIEVHRLKGLIRFQEIQKDFFYAGFEPDHDVLGFLLPHFQKRLASQTWMLHDRKRKKAAVFSHGKTVFVEPEWVQEGESDFFESLWQTYFEKISITERKNLRLQKQFMPRRYWKYLTEINKR